MSTGDKKKTSFEDKAVKHFATPYGAQPGSAQRYEPQTPTSTRSSFKSATQSSPRSLRSGASPFFGGSRGYYPPRKTYSRQSDSVTASPGSVGQETTPATTTSPSANPLTTQKASEPLSSPSFVSSTAPRTTASPSADSSSSLVASDHSTQKLVFSPLNPQTPSCVNLSASTPNTSVSRPPRRVIRPDNWWQNPKSQPLVVTEAEAPPSVPEQSSLRLLPPPVPEQSSLRLLPPPIPERSPLRLLRRPLRPLALQTARAPVATPRSHEPYQESYEDRALYEELSPPPLIFRKPRAAARPPRQLSPTAATNTLEPLRPRPLNPTLQRVSRLHGHKPETAQANNQKSVARSTEELSPEVIAHRQETLEILCNSPRTRSHDRKEWTRRFDEFLQRRRPGLNMASLRPDSSGAMNALHREAVRLAEAQQKAVVENCKRAKLPEPDYVFDELTGRGSFGRVYKGRQRSTNKVVAIKVIDIDKADFQAHGDLRDEQIRDFNREIRILRQAQESGAENLNQIIEALPVHSQLWMVCEFCPGGSVKTLMRATNDRLSERYIVVVARELAKALKGLHAAGILHRDVKAANVLIHQEGRLQLCDFGVSTVLDTQTDKRKTFIGTLHWMPPELWTENPEYSDEVDVWEYGCTLYECAVGQPPNADLRERQQLKMRMRRLKQAISLPEAQSFSDGLRSLVSTTLSPDVASRPSMADVLDHEYVKDTEESHPTRILTELVETYYAWVLRGGQRASLFMPGGAAAASALEPGDGDDEEWNFSMTQDFERRVSAILDSSDLPATESLEGEETPKGQSRPADPSPPTEMTAVERANFEARVQRGADLSNLFDQSRPAYDYKIKSDFIPIPEQRRISDLPFRAMAEDRPSSIASNVIDLGDFDESDYAVAATPRTDDKIQTAYAAAPLREETIRLADASTLRDKRANSKGPRDSTSQSLTARRTSSGEHVPQTTAAQDFAMSQEDWTVKNKTKAPELQEPAEITSSRPGHATMDWSFAAAMSEVAIPQIKEPEPEADNDVPGPSSDDTAAFEQKAKKHATMDWSFTQAMAEASNSEAVTTQSAAMNSSPPTQPPISTSSRPTPTRPAPLLRQMTMPVTIDDFAQAEEQEIPRPSTALSEAYSDISTASTDVDPFGLERDDDGDDEFPGASTLDDDAGPFGVGGFYSGRGRTLAGDRSQLMSSAPLTASGATAHGAAPYSLGRPLRVGEDGFTGLAGSAGHQTSARHGRNLSSAMPTAVSGGGSGSGVGSASGRPTVDVPSAQPPSGAVLSAAAPSSEVEVELTRLLEGMQGTLNAAREVVGGLVVGRKGAGGVTGESEWEDED